MSDGTTGLSRWKRPLLYVMGPLYVLAGVTHFLAPDAYERVVPPGFPKPRELVYASGVAEVALGLGVLHPKTREASAWGLVGLLVAVFPANVYMAVDDDAVQALPGGVEPSDAALWARLPLQAVLVAWAWWYTRPMADAAGDGAAAGDDADASDEAAA